MAGLKYVRMSHSEQRIYDLEDRLIAFAVLICRIADELPSTRVGIHVAGQLIRCGTSPAANYAEARAAESRKDFIHKMRLCLKELRETLVWLRFLRRFEIGMADELDPAVQESNELIAIFVKSIATAKRNARSRSWADKPHFDIRNSKFEIRNS